MIIICRHCKKKYVFDDKKIDASRSLKFKCKKCNQVIVINSKHEKIRSPVTLDVFYGDELKQEIIAKVKSLPPLPQILTKAIRIVNTPYQGASELSEVLEKDQAMATRILKIANSVYYAPVEPIASVKQACIQLGEESLLLLLTLACRSKLMNRGLMGYSLSSTEMFKHSLAVAIGSQKIAEKINPELSADAYSAGLIHDIGKMILDSYLVKRKPDFDNIIDKNNLDSHKAEKILFGFNHMELGYDYCTNWNLPEVQALAIRDHHYPSDTNLLSLILYVADNIANGPIQDFTNGEMDELFDDQVKEKLGFEADDFRNLARKIDESISEIIESVIVG